MTDRIDSAGSRSGIASDWIRLLEDAASVTRRDRHGRRDAPRLRRDVADPTRAPGWYRGDLHSHSVHSDGSNTVAEMAEAASAIGLDFLAPTDHNTISQWLFDAPSNGLLQLRGLECT